MAVQDFLAASPEALGVDSERLERALERGAREVRDGRLPSCQIAVARHGALAAFRSYGRVTHHGQPAQASERTLYAIFSCTKAITSAVAWQFIQEGKLGLDERVVDIVPEFATNGKERVRVEQLFTHTAGFPTAPFRAVEFLDHERRLARFRQWRLNWEPGSRFEYHATQTMYVIAEILERRSGRSYAELVRERIALPLGLPDLRCGLPRAEHGRLADTSNLGQGLSADDFVRLGVTPPEVNLVDDDAILQLNQAQVREAGIPGGGGTATAADLALFYQALLHGGARGGAQLWRPETLAMAREIRSGALTDPIWNRPANRALGVVIAGDSERLLRGFPSECSELAFGHNGAGGQLAWADPVSGISLGFVTDGHERNQLKVAQRGLALSGLVAALVG